jgi:hypothetical protein
MEPDHHQDLGLSGRRSAATNLSRLRPPEVTRKTYCGRGGANGAEVWVEEAQPEDGAAAGATVSRSLPLHLELRDHSPTGFAWGYSASGPAQLALALAMDATGDAELALRHYQELKRRLVAGWQGEWSITAQQVREFLAAAERESGAS